MPESSYDSIGALAHLFFEELGKTEEEPLHGAFQISSKKKTLPNGIKHCYVRIDCQADCGWLVEAYGPEAEELERKAISINNILHARSGKPFKSISELLEVLFPELEIKSQRIPIG